ncbi:hypothetical protein P4S72_03575 [Vibrio sp. PP-XX7]
MTQTICCDLSVNDCAGYCAKVQGKQWAKIVFATPKFIPEPVIDLNQQDFSSIDAGIYDGFSL